MAASALIQPDMGLHATNAILRSADYEMLGATGVNLTVHHAAPFTGCARQIEAALGRYDTEWFVTTDSSSLRESMMRSLPGKVVFAPWAPRHTSDATIASASRLQMIAEWQLLASDCDHLITSVSSFGLTAAAVAQSFRRASLQIISSAGQHLAVAPAVHRTVGANNSACQASTPHIEVSEIPWIRHKGGVQ